MSVSISAVNVKWGKEKFTGVECNTDEPPMVFKAQLFALSGVAPDRQKVMMKGIVLKVCHQCQLFTSCWNSGTFSRGTHISTI